MALDKSDVASIAHLARLNIDEADTAEYAQNLSSILDLVAQMQSVDTEGVEPVSNPLDAVQRLRADQVTESDARAQLQSAAPSVENGLFLVPQVIE